jgi:hypothetical protein
MIDIPQSFMKSLLEISVAGTGKRNRVYLNGK